MVFDPSKNEDLDDGREVSAKKIGDEILELATLKNRIFYEKTRAGSWWVLGHDKEWTDLTGPLSDIYFKRCGVDAVRGDKATNSDMDLAKLNVAQNYNVVYAGPLAGHNKGVQINNGNRVLVTRSPQIPAPDGSVSCEILFALIDQMFGPQEKDKTDQRDYFLAWWRHSLECLLDPVVDSDVKGLAVVLAGEAGCGKSLLKSVIKASFGGRECKPYQFMIGEENFNGDVLGAELWAIDDEQAATDNKSRSSFGASVKKIVADDTYRIRGMNRDGVSLNFFKRLLICVNREPERLMVLPQLDDDIAGKMSIFLCHSNPMPMAAGTREEKSLFWATLMEELPGFIYWMINVWECPAELAVGRFGVKEFHHPDLCRDLFEMSREHTLLNQLTKVLFSNNELGTLWYVDRTSTLLRDALTAEDAPLTKGEKNHVPLPSFFGKCLTKIAKEHPDRIRRRKSNGRVTWIVTKEDRTTEEALEMIRLHRGINQEEI